MISYSKIDINSIQSKASCLKAGRRCFTLQIPENITKEGIYKIHFKCKPFYKLYLHQNGLLKSDMPRGSPGVMYKDVERVRVTHEILQLKTYNKEVCKNDRTYRLDNCRHDYIYKVQFFHSCLEGNEMFCSI